MTHSLYVKDRFSIYIGGGGGGGLAVLGGIKALSGISMLEA